MSKDPLPSRNSWPFPARDYRSKRVPESNGTAHHDVAEQELADEQLERDRKATKAVDSKLPKRHNTK